MTEPNREELYKIINHVLANYGSGKDVSLTTEIKIYNEKYQHRLQTNPQLSIFEEAVPYSEEVKKAILFCEDLADYKERTDIDASDDVSPATCRRLLKQLAEYAPYLTPENTEICQRLTKTLKYYIPEYKKELLFAEYDKYITDIIERDKARKIKKKNKEKTAVEDAYIERLANHFFKTMKEDTYLKDMAACPEKMELYEKSVKIVDFLSSKQYSRFVKYNMKREIYEEISNIAEELGPNYASKAKKAKEEAQRFKKSADNIINPPKKKPVKRNHNSRWDFFKQIEERNRRAQEEYWNK